MDTAGDGRAAVAAVTARPPDIVLLDVMLPGEDGFEILARLRRTTDVPIIMLTGRDEEASRVLGLRLGADDYVIKPFSADELSARVASVLRRTQRARSSSVLEFDDLRIDLANRQVVTGGAAVELTAREFDLLAFLATSSRQVFSRHQLLESVWGSSTEWQDPGTVTEHVRRVRRKIQPDGGPARWVQTVRGVGYRFEPGPDRRPA